MSTVVQPYDAVVAQIAAAGTELATKAEAFVIKTDDDDLAAKAVLATVTKGLKAADERRKVYKAPALVECNTIDSAFKTATAPWESAKKTLAEKTGEYHKAKIEAEQAALRERERAEREAAEGRRTRTVDGPPSPPPVDLPPAPAPVATTAKTAAGDVSMVRNRGYQIVDETKIPREFWTLDCVRIAEIYRKGGDVPGCCEEITYTPRTRG